MSYKTYRLNNHDQSESSRVKNTVHSTIQKSNTAMGSRNSDWLRPLSLLTFFSKLKPEAENNNSLQGMVKLVLPIFFDGNELVAYKSALQAVAVDEDSVGIQACCLVASRKLCLG